MTTATATMMLRRNAMLRRAVTSHRSPSGAAAASAFLHRPPRPRALTLSRASPPHLRSFVAAAGTSGATTSSSPLRASSSGSSAFSSSSDSSPSFADLGLGGGQNRRDLEARVATNDRKGRSRGRGATSSSSSTSIIGDWIEGPTTQFGTGRIATLADGAVVGRCGDTVVLSTVTVKRGGGGGGRGGDPGGDEDSCGGDDGTGEVFRNAVRASARRNLGIAPLTVEYRERYHGVGRIPKNRRRRDNSGRTDGEVLAGRAVDRAIRPLLPKGGDDEDEIVVTCSVESYDGGTGGGRGEIAPTGGSAWASTSGDPVALAVNSASAALIQSGIPYEDGPVGCVKLCLLRDGTVIVDPPPSVVEEFGKFELLYAGNRGGALMVEFHAMPPRWEEGDDGAIGAATTPPATGNLPLPPRADAAGVRHDSSVGIPEDIVADLLRLAHASVQPIIGAQEEMRKEDFDGAVTSGGEGSSPVSADRDASSPTTFADLVRDLGLSTMVASSPPLTAKTVEKEEEEEGTAAPSDVPPFVASHEETAERLLQYAYEFVHDRVSEVSLRMFGHDRRPGGEDFVGRCLGGGEESRPAFANGLNGAVRGGGVERGGSSSPPKALLPKKVRGRREHVLRLEVMRLLRDEFSQSHSSNHEGNDESDSDSWAELDDATVDLVANSVFERLMKASMREAAVLGGCRGDGRNDLREVRPIDVSVPVLPDAVHGSAFFARGETQVLCTATLGAPREGIPRSDAWYIDSGATQLAGTKNGGGVPRVDTMPWTSSYHDKEEPPVGSLRYTKNHTALESDLNSRMVTAGREQTGESGTLDEVRRVFLHYDFSPFSVGGSGKGPKGGGGNPNRRAIGHGNLAEKAVLAAIPPPHAFPYTVRLTSEVTGSNGSSSMASACGATLALLDAGVPVLSPVAGVSVGLVVAGTPCSSSSFHLDAASGDGSHSLLLDINGTEDHYGEMDFKIAGTATGVTAAQLDVKLPGGVPVDVLVEAMEVAKDGRIQVLDEMGRQCREDGSGINDRLCPRKVPKATAPRVEIVRFNPARKRDLVGPGGAVLRQMEDRFGVTLDLSQDGQCLLYGTNATMVGKAKAAVMDLVADVEEGGVYEGTIITIKDFGAIVELLRNKEGILHVSELTDDEEASKHPEGNFGVVKDMLKVGQKLEVLCTEVDAVQGSMKLSRKKLLRRRRLYPLGQ